MSAKAKVQGKATSRKAESEGLNPSDSSTDVALRYFDRSLTSRERAIFEGGIALGSIYHQFVGTPISKDPKVVRALEEAIQRTAILQPYREAVKVKILTDRIRGRKLHAYDYDTLKGEHLDVKVVSRYGNCRVTSRMKHIPNLKHTLIYVEKVEEVSGISG